MRWGSHHAPGPGRRVDEDRCDGRVLGPDSGVFVVAGGLPGWDGSTAAAGQIAVGVVAGELLRTLCAAPEDQRGRPEQAVRAVESAVGRVRHVLARLPGPTPGAACTAVWVTVSGSRGSVGWLGDCRAHRLRAGALEPLTRDHRLAQHMADQGQIKPEEVATHPHSNVLLRCLDTHSDEPAKPDTRALELQEGDRLVLSTDGVWEALDPPVIARLAALLDPQEAAEMLVSLAHSFGGQDDAAALVVALNGDAR